MVVLLDQLLTLLGGGNCGKRRVGDREATCPAAREGCKASRSCRWGTWESSQNTSIIHHVV